jgi:Cdc6-like AAA superfamily ATPase
MAATTRTWSREQIARLRERRAQEHPREVAHAGTARLDWRFHEAAAVLSWFELNPTLQPIGRDADADVAALARLVADSRCVEEVAGRKRWVLQDDVRREILAQMGTRDRMRAALAANVTRPQDVVQRTLERFIANDVMPIEQQRLEELSATLQVLDWLPASVLADTQHVPVAADVRQRIAFETLLAPFRWLVNDQFRGRRIELATLRDYVGVREPSSAAERLRRRFREFASFKEKPPLVIYGPGGMGKSTLLAKFILEHTASEGPRIPFIYLDCDRRGLVAEEPLTLLLEGVRQLGVQFPKFARASRDISGGWQHELAASRQNADADDVSAQTAHDRTDFLHSFALFVEELGLQDAPLLLVVDTFEEIQYRGRAYVKELWNVFEEVQLQVPRLRTVVSGRARVGDDLPCEYLALDSLDAESAASFLEANGITDPDAARSIARQMRRNPLSLKLAVQVLRFEPGLSSESLAGAGNAFWRRLDDNLIQGQLYRRILSHISRDDVRRLAHPGLILRRITPDIIQQVLAKPCGVDVSSTAQADELFDALAREVSLVAVTSRSDREVRHRADVRRVMIELLRKSEKERVAEIERAAVAYYEKRSATDPEERAEEIYHRLGLGQPAAEVIPRWMPGVEEYLRSAVDDFSGAAQAFLAAQLDIDLATLTLEEQSDEAWEALVRKQADDLLRLGRPEEALRLLRARAFRSERSPLHLLEARALFALGRLREVGELTRRVIPEFAVEPSADLLDVQLLAGQAKEALGDPPGRHESAEEFARLARVFPNDIRLLSVGMSWSRLYSRASRESPESADARRRLEEEIVRAFAAMSDAVLRDSPALLKQLSTSELVDHPTIKTRLAGLAASSEEPPPPPSRGGGAARVAVSSILTGPQLRDFRDAFLGAFTNRSELDLLARQALDTSLALIAPETSTLAQQVLILVKYAEAEGRIPDLLSSARRLRPSNVKLRSLEASLAHIRQSAADPFAAVLVNGRPFLDRTVLRLFMRKASSARTGGRTLIVEGPRGSGKSYTAQFVRHCATTIKGFDVVSLSGSATLDEITSRLAIAAGWTVSTRPDRSVEHQVRYLRTLAEWVIANAVRSRTPLVLILDDLDEPTANEVSDFAIALALQLNTSAVTTLSLILLGLPPGRLSHVATAFEVEQLQPLQQSDVSIFLREIAREAYASDDVIDRVTSDITRRIRFGTPETNAQLNEYLSNVVVQLLHDTE